MFSGKKILQKIDLTKHGINFSIKKKGSFLFLILLSILFFGITAYSYNLQIVNSNLYIVKSALLNVKETEIQPQRGLILDKDGNPLLKNTQSYDMYLRKVDYTDDQLSKLAQVLKDNI